MGRGRCGRLGGGWLRLGEGQATAKPLTKRAQRWPRFATGSGAGECVAGDYQSAEALQGAAGSPRGRVRVLGWSLDWRRVMWAMRASAPDCSATGLMEL